MAPFRTSIKLLRSWRTGSVRSLGRGGQAGLLLLTALLPGFDAVAGESEGVAARQRQEARGWLQLEQDQRAYRERVEPLSPQGAITLKGMEQRQQLELRELQVRQRREWQSERRRLGLPEAERPSPRMSAPGLKRDFDRKRLEMRLQRDTFGH